MRFRKYDNSSALMEDGDLTRMLGRPFSSAHIRVAARKEGQMGNCFEAAAMMMTDLGLFGLDKCGIDRKDWQKRAVLAHGIITGQGPIEGQPHPHAWVEYQGVAFDLSNNRAVVLPAAFYLAMARPVMEPVRYAHTDALKQLFTSGHFGPWDKALNDAAEQAEGD